MMALNEAKEVFINRAFIQTDDGSGIIYDPDKWREACYVISKWIEQEPCEDTISRQAVIDGINEYFHDEYYQRTSIQDCRDCLIEDVINDMPPVTPLQKTGHWIDNKCSVCGRGIEDLIDSCEWYKLEEPKFCPFCGVKIVKK